MFIPVGSKAIQVGLQRRSLENGSNKRKFPEINWFLQPKFVAIWVLVQTMKVYQENISCSRLRHLSNVWGLIILTYIRPIPMMSKPPSRKHFVQWMTSCDREKSVISVAQIIQPGVSPKHSGFQSKAT